MVCQRKMWIPVFIVSLLLVATYGASVYGADEKDPKQQKVAEVNGSAITQGEMDQEMGRYEQQLKMAGQTATPEQVGEVREKVLKGLVDRELLAQQTKKLGIATSDAEVDEQMATLKKRFSNEAQFADALTKMNLTEVQLKDELRQDKAIRKMIDQEVAGKVTLTDQDVKAFYDGHPEFFKTSEMVRASHILIKVDPKASEADKAKARERILVIQKKVQEGGDFAALAKESSECPSSENGGDLDYFERGQMVGPFEETAFSLKPGTVSDIVETQFGYHIIKVTDKKEPGVTPYEEIKDKIQQHLKQQKVTEQLTLYVDQLRSQAKIETFIK